MATLTQTGGTPSSVTITCSGLDPEHRFTRYFWWQIYLNGTKIAEYGDSLAPYSSSHTGSFSGLTESTAYTVQCGIYNDSAYTELLALLSCQADTSAAPTPTTVKCYVVRWYDGTQDQVFGPYSMTPGGTYSVSTYMPSYDSSSYDLDSIMLNGVTPVIGATFTAPSRNFFLDFYFVFSTNAYIWDGSQWVPAVAYIWDGSQWVPARANIYDGGWQP